MARKRRTYEATPLDLAVPRSVGCAQARRLEARKTIRYGLVVTWTGCRQVATGIIAWLRALAD